MNRQKTIENASSFEKYKESHKTGKVNLFVAEIEWGVPWKKFYALI